jgi:nicotinic acid mononucleotide adenylyltransferase
MASVVHRGFSATTSTQETGIGQFKGKKVIIYTPITGNPTHLGHLNVAAEAAKTVQKAGAVACGVFFSLASQSYLQSKQSADSLKLNEQQRQRLLELTIQDSKKYFPQAVNPEFCGFEGQGQHVQKYRDIQALNPDSFVVLAAGADLQIRMSDWKTQRQFFAFIQNRGTDKGISGPNRIVLEESKEFSHVSSTEIRKAVLGGRQPVGIGPLATDYLKQLVPLPFRFQQIQKRFPVYKELLAEIARRFPTLECRTTDIRVTSHPTFGNIVVPVAILEPPLTTPKLENLPKVFNLANTISINRSYPNPMHDIKFDVNGTTYTCHRPNHNGTHSYRQVRYLEILLDLTAKYGRQEAKAFCQKLTEKDLVNLKLATFFLRAGRLDESGPSSSDPKRLRSFELYQHYASAMGITPQVIEETKDLILDSCTPNGRLQYKDRSLWNPKAFLQTLITLAHEVDLVRCFPDFEQRTKPSLVENLSGWVLDAKTDANIVAASLQKFGIEANTLVGQQVAVESKPYDRQRFFVHSTYGEYCRYRLSKLEFSMDSSSSLPSAASPAKPPQSKPSTPKKESCILM